MNEKNKITEFDFTQSLNPSVLNDIQDKVEKLRQICGIYNIPMFTSVCLKNSNEGTEYFYRGVFADTAGLTLKDDKILDYLKVMIGMKPIYQPDDDEISDGEYTAQPFIKITDKEFRELFNAPMGGAASD